ncbi:hypothetical protein MXB_4002 [Myxobolus squamalis]|nr:hypothetical protein MXB_4002 [Myxobolus squamalis]
MAFIVVTFINAAKEDIRIKSVSGPLSIDTIFRKETTSRITMWVPSQTQVELIALDKFGNILLMNGNSTVLIDTNNYPTKPFYITSPDSNSDSMDRSQTDNSEDERSEKKSSHLYQIRNHLNHNNIKFFVAGKEKETDSDEKIYSFPSADHLVLDQTLIGEKIFATDSLTGSLLSINGNPYFQAKEANEYKKNFLTELSINYYGSDINQSIC